MTPSVKGGAVVAGRITNCNQEPAEPEVAHRVLISEEEYLGETQTGALANLVPTPDRNRVSVTLIPFEAPVQAAQAVPTSGVVVHAPTTPRLFAGNVQSLPLAIGGPVRVMPEGAGELVCRWRIQCRPREQFDATTSS